VLITDLIGLQYKPLQIRSETAGPVATHSAARIGASV
jgi:hypothetical protein